MRRNMSMKTKQVVNKINSLKNFWSKQKKVKTNPISYLNNTFLD